MMTTNVFESFNGVLKGTRNLPVRSLVARTFHRLNHYFVERRTQGEEWTSQLAPRWAALARRRMEESRLMCIERYSFVEWQVKDVHMFDYTVTIENNVAKCSCNMPTLDHFPCSHVLAACSRGSGGANRAYFDLISPWYTKAMYSAAYAPLFHPVTTLERLRWPNYTTTACTQEFRSSSIYSIKRFHGSAIFIRP